MNTSDPKETNSSTCATAMSAATLPPVLRGRDATLEEFNCAAERVVAAYGQALSELKDE